MPFIPHTEKEIADMLNAIGVDSIEDLFEEIPANLRAKEMTGIPESKTEMEVSQLLHSRASQNSTTTCFLGAGAYEHHIPAAVWQITTRGEFYSAYTPYQAEASQGTLQLTYEFQSMMTALTAMDVSNASMYDGASSLAEAILMAVRGNRKSKSRTILIPKTVHPNYRKASQAIVSGQNVNLVEVDYDAATGITPLDNFKNNAESDITAVVIQQPNFFGSLEQVDEITD
jgi:glycine dehydrogenase subunit 1